MSDGQIRATPQAPTVGVSSPTTANAAAQDTINPAPATQHTTQTANAPATTPLPGTHTSPVEEPVTLNDKLNAGDRYWKFKGALQAVLIITGFIGIGCIGWLISNTEALGYGYSDSYWALWPSLITFSVSIVWCAACIIVLVVRKTPVHPGARVALDLLLWLAFIATALLATFALTEIFSWGSYGELDNGYFSSSGGYQMAANGTWVWEQDNNSVSSPRSCNETSSYYDYYPTYQFKDCAEQDAYINKLWQEKPHRARVELTGVVCQYFGLLLHFVLFVWACVDTHRYNRGKVSTDAEKLAASIVQTMITNGAIVPPPGQASMRPGAAQGMYHQLPPHGTYPLAALYPQNAPGQQPYMAPGQQPHTMPVQHHAGPSAGPSNEKGDSLRYA